MNGAEILDRVRILTEAGWSSFDEINEAYEFLLQRIGMRLSRIRDETSLTFKSDISVYQLPFERIRRLEGIAVKGLLNKQEWRPLSPLEDEDFDGVVFANRSTDGTDKADIPQYYRISQGSTEQMEVTPTPDSDYPMRLTYLGNPASLDGEATPILPGIYHRQIANLAAGYILQRGDDQAGQVKGVKLERDVHASLFSMLNDVANNRAGVARPSQAMMRT